MNFQGLGKIETADTYLDIAFNRAQKGADDKREDIYGHKKISKLLKSRKVELVRIQTAAANLQNILQTIVDSFPQLNHLPPFYQELVRITIDYDQMKKSFGALLWAKNKIHQLHKIHAIHIGRSTIENINSHRKAFYGRVSSIMKQIKKDFIFLDACRRTMKDYPTIKTSMPTVIIAGYPNTGKSTLLRVLTGATPKEAAYPFTTQQLMLGYDKENNLQFVDTPGLLDRPLKKRNKIELHAILALSHLDAIILFLFDVSGQYYGQQEQENLFKDVKKMFKKTPLVVLNKVDEADHQMLHNLRERYNNAILISAKNKEGIPLLSSEIAKLKSTSAP